MRAHPDAKVAARAPSANAGDSDSAVKYVGRVQHDIYNRILAFPHGRRRALAAIAPQTINNVGAVPTADCQSAAQTTCTTAGGTVRCHGAPECLSISPAVPTTLICGGFRTACRATHITAGQSSHRAQR